MSVGEGGEAVGSARRALAWLGPRLDGVPPALAEAVRACVRRAEGPEAPETVPELLARAAVEELDAVSGLPGDRDTALRLLAADASLTYAFESAAEAGHDVEALAAAVGLRGRIGRRLDALVGVEAPGSGRRHGSGSGRGPGAPEAP